MSEALLAKHCSPILAGMKTGNLFACSFPSEYEMKECVGCWKVYGDIEAAQKTFAKYKKCTDVYCDQFAKGRSIERLTVVG